MAYTTGSILSSNDIKDLKARVKAEMGRRKYTGSLESWATDFTYPANAGDIIKLEHFNETVGYINKIKDTGLTAERNKLIYEIDAAVTRLASNEDRSLNHMTDSSGTDCASSCTGLCQTACSGGCRGCSGTCSGSCTSCSGCSGSCSGSCSGCSGCSGSCSGSCSGCSGSCSGGCSGCGNACHGWCNNACWVDYCWTNSSYY